MSDVDDLRRPAPEGAVESWDMPCLVEKWLAAGETDLYRRALEHFDRLMVRIVVERADGNQGKAAALLGLSRVTLRAKLRSLGMQVKRTLTADASRKPIHSSLR